MTTLQDPCPTCDGVFLTGNAADHMTCIMGAASNDQDHDGVHDGCEFKVADAFKPDLVFHHNEVRTSRESYWAVRRSLTPGWRLTIAYLLGYHEDSAHAGDSELIQVEVEFDTTLTTGNITGRWIVRTAKYSAHLGIDTYYANQLEFTGGQFGDRPRSWVAKGKHANYNSHSNCESGGLLGSDFCDSGFVEPVDVLSNRNIGSDLYRFIDEVRSVDPVPNPGTEWMWSQNQGEVCGWQIPCWRDIEAEPFEVKPYGKRLADLGWVIEF